MPRPSSPRPSAKPQRCTYADGRRRCIRNGSGAPALCHPHRIVLEDAARRAAAPRPAQRAADVVAGVVDDLLHGRPFDSSKIKSAINDFAWGLGGGFPKYQPDIGPAPGGWDPGPATSRRYRRQESPPEPEPAPAPEDPAIEREARRVLGFGPGDMITADLLKGRHRELAKRHHPDRGGSLARMQQINSAVDVLAAKL